MTTRWMIPYLVTLAPLCLLAVNSSKDYVFGCEYTEYVVTGIGDHGNISIHSNNSVTQCKVKLIGCDDCSFSIDILHVSISNISGLEWEIREPHYNFPPYMINTHNTTWINISTLSNTVWITLKIPDAFLVNNTTFFEADIILNYHTLSKTVHISGYPSDDFRSGYLEAPNYPHGYATRGEKYTYILENVQPRGKVYVYPVDIDMSRHTTLSIYSGSKEEELYLLDRLFGTSHTRPVVLSTANILTLVFMAEVIDSNISPLRGFRVAYKFVNSEYMEASLPSIGDCSRDISTPANKGTLITGTSVDCWWKLQSTANIQYNVFVIRQFVLSGSAKNATITVTEGDVPTSQLVYKRIVNGQFEFESTQSSINTTKGGFRIGVQGDVEDFRLHVGTSRYYHTSSSCDMSSYQCDKNSCVSRNKVCDHVIDCYDNTDESQCNGILPVTDRSIKSCDKGQLSCDHGTTCISHVHICDHIQDCLDGADEDSCNHSTSTALPDSYRCTGSNMVSCDTGTQCIFTWQKCDRYYNCDDRSDEINCDYPRSQSVAELQNWRIFLPVCLCLCFLLVTCASFVFSKRWRQKFVNVSRCCLRRGTRNQGATTSSSTDRFLGLSHSASAVSANSDVAFFRVRGPGELPDIGYVGPESVKLPTYEEAMRSPVSPQPVVIYDSHPSTYPRIAYQQQNPYNTIPNGASNQIYYQQTGASCSTSSDNLEPLTENMDSDIATNRDNGGQSNNNETIGDIQTSALNISRENQNVASTTIGENRDVNIATSSDVFHNYERQNNLNSEETGINCRNSADGNQNGASNIPNEVGNSEDDRMHNLQQTDINTGASLNVVNTHRGIIELNETVSNIADMPPPYSYVTDV